MRTLTKTLTAGAATAALLMGATGCSNPVEDLVEQAVEDASGGEIDIDSDSGTVEIETEDGSAQYGEGVELPSDFPSAVPLPGGALIAATVSEGTYALTYDGIDKAAVDALRSELVASGFEELTVTESEGYLQGGWSGNGYDVSIIWTGENALIYGASPTG